MVIKEKELFEYIKCPLRYKFLSNNHMLEEGRTFKKLAYSVIKHYLSVKTNGVKTADYNTLKRKWDKVASENSDIFNPKKVLEAWGMLYRTYEHIEVYDIKFMEVNLSYTIDIPRTGVCLTGVLDPLIDKGDHIEIFIVCFDKTMPDSLSIDSRLKHTIDAYVIKKIFNKDVVINYYVPAQGKCIQTLRGTNDFNRLENIVSNIGKAIKNKIIFPRETFMCSSCLTRDLCKHWTGGDNNE